MNSAKDKIPGYADLIDKLAPEDAVRVDALVMANEDEMEAHCNKYPCKDCPISGRCSMFYNMFRKNFGPNPMTEKP